MERGKRIKRILDLAMVILMPFLMAQILTGQKLHEWLGCIMAICVIFHNILNFRWYKNINKGDYSPVRCLMTVINFLTATSMIAIIVSGILMSDYVFSWIGITGHYVFARRLHLFTSWWGLILISGHLGLHWKMIMKEIGKLFKIKGKNTMRTILIRISCAVLSAYGVYAFVVNHVNEYIFMKTHFMYYDEKKGSLVFLLETVAMIILFAVIFYYFEKGLLSLKDDKIKSSKLWKILAFLIPATFIILLWWLNIEFYCIFFKSNLI